MKRRFLTVKLSSTFNSDAFLHLPLSWASRGLISTRLKSVDTQSCQVILGLPVGVVSTPTASYPTPLLFHPTCPYHPSLLHLITSPVASTLTLLTRPVVGCLCLSLTDATCPSHHPHHNSFHPFVMIRPSHQRLAPIQQATSDT